VAVIGRLVQKLKQTAI